MRFLKGMVTDRNIEDSNKGAEMTVIVLLGKAMSKDGGGDKKRPHRPHQRCET
jgi:hypothetical protein